MKLTWKRLIEKSPWNSPTDMMMMTFPIIAQHYIDLQVANGERKENINMLRLLDMNEKFIEEELDLLFLSPSEK